MKNALKNYVVEKTASQIAHQVAGSIGEIVEHKEVENSELLNWLNCCLPADTDGLTAVYRDDGHDSTLEFNQIPVPLWASDTLESAGWTMESEKYLSENHSRESQVIGHYLSAILGVMSLNRTAVVQPVGQTTPARKNLRSKDQCERIARWLLKIGTSKMKKAETKLDPPVASQNKTQRRIEIAKAMRIEGVKLMREAEATIALAKKFEDGPEFVPEVLQWVSNNTHIETIMRTQVEVVYDLKSLSEEKQKRLKACKIKTADQLKEARKSLNELINHDDMFDVEEKIARQTKEDSLVGKPIPGFFPTPQKIADLIVKYASITEGCTILEPSCGKGDIITAVINQHPANEVVGVEINSELYSFSETLFENSENVNIFCEDFRGWNEPSDCQMKFDRILMNPPFNKGADLKHIERAIGMLKENGMLVTLAANGATFPKIMKMVEAQEDLNSYTEKLPEGSFAKSDSFRKTGVDVNLIVIAKSN